MRDLCAGETYAAARCLSGKLVHLYLNSQLVFEYNATSRRGTEVATAAAAAGGSGPVFRDHQHHITPTDRLAIGCCVDANSTVDYGIHSSRACVKFSLS